MTAEQRLLLIREKLQAIVCTEPPDDGVVLLSDDGPTHPEVRGGETVQVYNHEHFSPLGDALIELWELSGGRNEAMAGQITQNGIYQREQKLETMRRQFLRQQGWTDSCQYPGSLWLWGKTLPDGRTITGDELTALSIEAALSCDYCAKPNADCQCDFNHDEE